MTVFLIKFSNKTQFFFVYQLDINKRFFQLVLHFILVRNVGCMIDLFHLVSFFHLDYKTLGSNSAKTQSYNIYCDKLMLTIYGVALP